MLSPYIIAIIAAWLTAQGGKYLLVSLKTRSLNGLRYFYLSGDMPSAHTATVISLVTVIALIDGVQSGLFGLAVLFAGITMYDAIMVRRSTGEQGIAIQSLIKELKSAILVPRAAKGHRPVEVLVGAGLGVLVGAVVFLATR